MLTAGSLKPYELPRLGTPSGARESRLSSARKPHRSSERRYRRNAYRYRVLNPQSASQRASDDLFFPDYAAWRDAYSGGGLLQ
jgi:hypothetical protein